MATNKLGKQLLKVGRHLRRYSGLEAELIARRKSSEAALPLDKQSQLRLLMDYRERAARGGPLPDFQETEFRSWSQHGEDGLLLFLFGVVGFGSRRSVEMCCGDGLECNSANLIIHHAFRSLLVDARTKKLARGRAFYEQCKECRPNRPILLESWITRDGVDPMLTRHGFAGEIDLLSIDLDGMDYWIWEAVTVAEPRVVAIEYNAKWPASRSLTVPYQDDFVCHDRYRGASLAALVKLGRRKGYRLVGCQRGQVNAFFVRDDLAPDLLPEIDAADCLGLRLLSDEEQQATLQREEWVEV